MPPEKLFAAISNFGWIERMLMRQGVSVMRIDPMQDPGTGMGWNLIFDWRARPRKLRMVVVQFDRPERLSLEGRSDGFELRVDMSVVALSRVRSRLIFEMDLRPLNMRSRLILQTAKLGKAQLDRRFDRRIGQFVEELSRA